MLHPTGNRVGLLVKIRMHIAVSAGACIDQEIASQRAAGGQMAEEPRKGAECAVGIIAPTGTRGGSPDVAMIPPPRRDVSRQRTFELRGKITEADTVPLRIIRIDDIRPTSLTRMPVAGNGSTHKPAQCAYPQRRASSSRLTTACRFSRSGSAALPFVP